MKAPIRSWRLALASSATLLVGALMIAGSMQVLVHAIGAKAPNAGIFGSILLVWGLVCVMLGVGTYYGRSGAIRGARLMAWLIILMLAIVLAFQWGDSAGPGPQVLMTILLIIFAGLWHWLIVRARMAVKGQPINHQ
ncbi:MAG: hypothetical protein IT446_06035 [Phycisphaerales bacterium]|nr:hypothetical protein [Phycisphaerales bacterium]